MLNEPEFTLNELFAQLGLDSSDEAIDKFVAEHKLAKDEELKQASFWTDAQRQFLTEEWERDAGWVEVIDELNVRLHPDA